VHNPLAMRPALLLPLTLLALAAGCAHTAGNPSSAPTAAAPDIKVGRCGKIADLAETRAAGFDYLELGVRDIAKLSDAEFAEAQARHKEVGLPTPVANVFLPNEMKVVGPGIDHGPVLEYARKAFDRMALLGVKTIVFGSGGARKVPDGFSHEEAFAQLVDLAKKLAPEAQSRGITLAVEPLRKQETNIINTAAEGLKWVEAVNHPSFQLMVDFYHLANEKEDPGIIVQAREHIRHFHIANPTGRVFPMDAAEFDYAGFFAAIKKINYHGGISVEAGTKNFPEEGPKALAFLRTSLGVTPPPAVAAAGK
jgi:D-psicose/D-tagatose/L-ribulose 3-epimerase